jgi:quercetin dioxygenase-like cupin family protein
MAAVERKSFDVPDEVRNPYEKGRVDVLNVGDTREWEAKRVTIEPEWRFSKHTSPVTGTELCETFHIKYFLQGRFGVRMKDGTEMEFGPGDIGIIDPGHDAWIVGDEPCSFIDLAEVAREAGATP